MKLYEALRSECIAVNAAPADKAAALREVVRAAKQCPDLAGVEEQDLLEGIEEREALGSTGFGRGIAIPHCRLAGASEFVVGIVTVPGGVDFDALDGEPVHLLVFIIGPAEASNEHIRMLSAVSHVLHTPGAVQEVVAEATPEAVRESFLRHSRVELDTEGHEGKRLVHVFVQDEDVFHDVVQIFAGMDSSSVVVLTSENLSAHFGTVPLFQGLWHHEPGGFSQLIVAVVDRGLTNETVRRIETAAGGLDRRTGVLVTVQDVFYSAGALAT